MNRRVRRGARYINRRSRSGRDVTGHEPSHVSARDKGYEAMSQINARWTRLALGAATVLVLGGWQAARAELLPGGGPTKSDCYVETDVTGLDAATVENSKRVTCTDGDACDTGACGDDACTFEIAICINQTDP